MTGFSSHQFRGVPHVSRGSRHGAISTTPATTLHHHPLVSALTDFTPFGGEKSYTSTCPQNYKFEGKERDTETQNDDFGARYYSWRFGRWLSSDWSSVPVAVPYANLNNPQTLNLYSMVADDPESFADLDGHTSNGGAGNSAAYCGNTEPAYITCVSDNDGRLYASTGDNREEAAVAEDAARATAENAERDHEEDQEQAQNDSAQTDSAQNTSNATAPSGSPDNPKNLQLVPTSDDGKDHQSYREVVYEVRTKDGKQPEGTWYVTEHQTNKSVASQDGVPGVSGGKENNKFTDLIGCLACRNVESKQTFTISTTSGVKAKSSFPIFVHSKAGDFGTLGLHIDSGGVRINGGLNWFTNPTGP